MLNLDELLSLSHLLRNDQVLSVYLDGTATDPASQHAWRIQLDNSLKDIGRWLSDASHDEREAFSGCVEILERQLANFKSAVGAQGWVAFISRQAVHVAERLPVPMPTLAVWSTGICIAPYIRALKQMRPVIIATGDARKIDLYRYEGGVLADVESISAGGVSESHSHMGDAPSHGFHAGTRGSTGHDAEQRALISSTDRMIDEVADRVTALATSHAWVLTGGIPHVADQLKRALAHIPASRVLRLPSLDVHASMAEIVAAAQRGASMLRDEADRREITRIIENSGSADVVALGPDSARKALTQMRVQSLFLTPRYLDDNLADAEDAVRLALTQHASVEIVSREVAEQLNAHGGMAARLRYSLTAAEAELVGATDAGAEE